MRVHSDLPLERLRRLDLYRASLFARLQLTGSAREFDNDAVERQGNGFDGADACHEAPTAAVIDAGPYRIDSPPRGMIEGE